MKSSATTGIEIIWNSHVTGSAGFCNFHIRVDGATAIPGYLGAVIQGDNTYHPVSTTDIYTGLTAGSHAVTLWDRGVGATSCTDNPGNYTRQLIVIEYQT